MANDITWWKDRDEWMPGRGDDPPAHSPSDKDPDLPQEDAGDVTDDSSGEFDDVDLPERDLDR